MHLSFRMLCIQNALGVQKRHFHRSSPCLQMLAPIHSLQRRRSRPCSQKLAGEHLLQSGVRCYGDICGVYLYAVSQQWEDRLNVNRNLVWGQGSLYLTYRLSIVNSCSHMCIYFRACSKFQTSVVISRCNTTPLAHS